MYTLKVLAVDDELGMRSGIARSLKNFKLKIPEVEEEVNFNVQTAESAEEGLEIINSFQPDILLLDYKLPGMSGLELLEQLGNIEDKMLTIMITAFASLETAVSAIKTGAFDFVAKPFTPIELRKSVTKAAQTVILARQLKKMNEERKQIRFQFISVLGHELKAPLGSIEGYLYMIKDRAIGEELPKYDNMVERCLVRTEQMRKLIGDLLEMTKIESGQRQRDLVEIDLTEFAKNSIDTFKPDALKQNILVNLISFNSIKMQADVVEIEIIMNNLISNAVKYNRENGKVDVTITKTDDKICIQVSDTGIGLNEEECAKLFKEFVRIKNKKTKDILGTGLGLSTIKKISELYNGNIEVKSQPDVGTTFKVNLKDTIF